MFCCIAESLYINMCDVMTIAGASSMYCAQLVGSTACVFMIFSLNFIMNNVSII